MHVSCCDLKAFVRSHTQSVEHKAIRNTLILGYIFRRASRVFTAKIEPNAAPIVISLRLIKASQAYV
jgi:hypothetical protein